jgi:ELWxxDGT repeat protein
MRATLILSAMLLAGSTALAAPPVLLRDVNAYPHARFQLGEAVAVGATLYVVVTDATHGRELAVVDAVAGTVDVLDLSLGAEDSSPFGLAVLGDRVLFTAHTPGHGTELWSTDGTMAGTKMQELMPGEASSSPFVQLVHENGFAFCSATTPGTGEELMQTDGISAPSVLDVVDGAFGSSPREITALPGGLIFSASGPFIGEEPWTLSIGGLEPLRDITGDGIGSSPREFTYLPSIGRVVFSAAGDGQERELWITDFTEVGTVLLKNLDGGPASSDPMHLLHLPNDVVIFRAQTPAAGSELWRTDGSPGGTTMIGDAFPGTTSGVYSPPVLFGDTKVLAPIYFPDAGVEPAVTDGTTITRLADAFAGPTSSWSEPDANALRRGVAGSRTYFALDDGLHGSELWRTDGTPGGTSAVADLRPGLGAARPDPLASNGGMLWFFAYGPDGPALWTVTGDAAPVEHVDLTTSGTDSARVYDAATVGDHVLFKAYDDVAGAELWRTDGTTAGTVRLVDIVSGSQGSDPRFFEVAGGALFFIADSQGRGDELFRSDGTAAGTGLVKDIEPGAVGSSIFESIAFGDRLLFTASTTAAGSELWISDGTADGTRLVSDLVPGPDGGQPYGLVAVGDRAFFATFLGAGGLWITDGTTAGTQRLAEVLPTTTPTAFGSGRVLFGGYDPTFETELWISDGTPTGTQPVADLDPVDASEPSRITAAGTRAFFGAYTIPSSTAAELWVTDGTAPNTTRLAQLTDAGVRSFVFEMVALGDRVVFTVLADDDTVTLWASDGTEAGTHPIEGVCPVADCRPQNLFVYEDTVFLEMNDGTHGRSLWQTDGTTAGTRLVDDTAPGPDDWFWHYQSVAFLGGRIFFGACDPAHDCEPWLFDYDQCPADRGKLAPGNCGCGVADADTDGSGVTDCLLSDELRQRIDALVALIEPITKAKGKAARKALRERRLQIRAALDALQAYHDAHAASFPAVAEPLRPARKAVLKVTRNARGAKKPKKKALAALATLRQAVP